MRSTIVLCCSLGVLTATAAPESAAECNRYRSTADTTKLQISSDWRTVDQYPVTDRAKTFDLRTCGTSIVGSRLHAGRRLDHIRACLRVNASTTPVGLFPSAL